MKGVLPRRLHPGAWWLWAGSLVAAAAQTTNPLLLAGIIAVCGLTVAARKPPPGWARGYRAYLILATVVIAIRVTFRILLGGDFGDRVLFVLPRLPLTAGAGLGGNVTLEEILAGLYDGLRLGAIVVCVGAANTLADPRRLLGSLPRALGALSASVVVALSLAPQLIESIGRVRRAQRLRGETVRGWRSLRGLLVPVLEDTLHRSLTLAASMDSRGYGRWHSPGKGRRLTRALIWTGPATMCVGLFWLLTGNGSTLPGILVAAGASGGAAGLYRVGRGVVRTRYRPEPWSGAEWTVSVSGLAAAAGLALTDILSAGALHPSLQPLTWPAAHPLALAALAVAMLPGVAAPPLPRPVAPSLGKAAS